MPTNAMLPIRPAPHAGGSAPANPAQPSMGACRGAGRPSQPANIGSRVAPGGTERCGDGVVFLLLGTARCHVGSDTGVQGEGRVCAAAGTAGAGTARAIAEPPSKFGGPEFPPKT